MSRTMIAVVCDACGADFETDEWSAKNGLMLCNECAAEFADHMDYERQGL